MSPMNREEWLEAAIERLVAMLRAAGADVPPVRVSCSFPGTRPLAPIHYRIGECWLARTPNNPDHRAQILVSPLLDDAVEVLGVIVHELCHAALPVGTGHRGAFKRLATACGLAGKMTATVPGPELTEKLRLLVMELGAYPHTRLRRGRFANPEDPESPEIPEPRQTTRLRLWECACPVKVRVASDDFRATCDRCGGKFEKNGARRLSAPGPDAPRGEL